MDNFMFFENPAFLASSIVLICYVVLFSEKINRAVTTMIAASVMILSGIVTQSEAISAIDFNTISLLIGMMIIVSITERSGLFQFVAMWSAQRVKANPVGILIMLSFVTAVFSAFLDNVTTVLLIVPVTLQITSKLEITPYPFLLLEIFAANIGGTATLIGDPPNILIGSALELSFTDFLFALSPVVLISLVILTMVFALIWKKVLITNDRNRVAIMSVNVKEHITDLKLLKQSLFVLFGVMGGFITAEQTHIENGVIALAGAAALLLIWTLDKKQALRDEKTEETFNLVDWTTIFFFMGLFMVVSGLEKTGILEKLGHQFVQLTQGSIQKSAFMMLGVSAVVSSAIDNIPFVATMIPILKSMEGSLGTREAMMPVWWALSLGACFGGNGTLIGASANVIVAGMAARSGRPIRFLAFLWWSVPVTILSVLIGAVFLYFKFFAF